VERVIAGRPLVAGEASGPLLVSSEPLSFWGGFDAASGEIIDRRHPLYGKVASGCVLALPSTRGSSTTTAVLLQAIRDGRAPAALLTRGVDTFLALASIVADEMYGLPIPVVALDADDFAALVSASRAHVHRDGHVVLS
jgi:cis-L-3-hydroxyproline dehydratase